MKERIMLCRSHSPSYGVESPLKFKEVMYHYYKSLKRFSISQ